MQLERANLLQIYYLMRLTRAVEDRTRTLFLQGRVVGGVYTGQGHEATTVGSAILLRRSVRSPAGSYPWQHPICRMRDGVVQHSNAIALMRASVA